MILALATGLARQIIAPAPAVLKSAVGVVNGRLVSIEATNEDEVETLEQLLDDAARYGSVTQDVVEMTRLRHSDEEDLLTQRFRNAVEAVLEAAERNPNLIVSVRPA